MSVAASFDWRCLSGSTMASGWSGCRMGLAPTGKRRLITAHTQSRRFRGAQTTCCRSAHRPNTMHTTRYCACPRPRLLTVATSATRLPSSRAAASFLSSMPGESGPVVALAPNRETTPGLSSMGVGSQSLEGAAIVGYALRARDHRASTVLPRSSMSAAPAIHSGARKFIPEQSENLHLSRSAAN